MKPEVAYMLHGNLSHGYGCELLLTSKPEQNMTIGLASNLLYKLDLIKQRDIICGSTWKN